MTNREERVLVMAPTGRDGALACSMLRAEGLMAEVCPTVDDLRASLADAAGALLIAEEALPPPAIRRLEKAPDERPEDRRRALESGSQSHLPKPVEPSELVAAMASMAEHRWH
jgi:CheY-like chemotaxis protein